MNNSKLKRFEPYLYMSPALITLLLVLVYPLLYGIFISFFSLNLSRPDLKADFIGFANYEELLTNLDFWYSLGLTFFLTVAFLCFELVIGTAIALMLQRKFWGRGVIRTLVFLPMMITPVVAGLTFRSLIFNTAFGMLNYFLSIFGMSPVPWLSNPKTALFSIFCGDTWMSIPFMALIILAGLESLPTEPYEAATIDGASGWQVFRMITLPLLKPPILVAVVFRTIYALRIFDVPFIMTKGGPGIATQTMSLLAFKKSMVQFQISEGAALSVIMLLITSVFAFIYVKLIVPNNEFDA